MGNSEIVDFFNRLASSWDAEMIKDDEIIGMIMDHAEVHEGTEVLDVATGTGVLIPYYTERGVKHVTAIDIAEKMTDIASDKYGDMVDEGRLDIICDDVLEHKFMGRYDVIMVYNAFPHFSDYERLLCTLAGLLKKGGRLSIAHGMSRDDIEQHHTGCPKNVAFGLPKADELTDMMGRYLKVTCVISDERMYQVVGVNA